MLDFAMTAPTTEAAAEGTSHRLVIREATEADDGQICALIRRNGMPGSISLATSHEPSFFASIQPEGYAHKVVVSARDGEVVGVATMTKRRAYINGEPKDLGYLSSMRADPSIRGGSSVARGNKLLRQWHNEGFGPPFYLGSVLSSNKSARKLLTSGRAGLFSSTDIGTLYTASIPLLKRRQVRPPAGVRIACGGEVGAEAIVEFLNRVGKTKQFFPVYTVEDLLAEDGILRGLSLDDFFVALSGVRVVGIMACWNQLPFRRLVVTGYSGAMYWLKPLVSPLCRVLGLAPLPNPGEPVQSVTASCIAVEENHPRIFNSLLSAVLRAECGTGKTFLMVGLMEGDPLLPVVRRYLHLPTRSCVYAMEWDNNCAAKELDGRQPYLELGSL